VREARDGERFMMRGDEARSAARLRYSAERRHDTLYDATPRLLMMTSLDIRHHTIESVRHYVDRLNADADDAMTR